MARSSKKRGTKRRADAQPPESTSNPGLPDPASVVGKKKVTLGGRNITIIHTNERDEYEEDDERERKRGH